MSKTNTPDDMGAGEPLLGNKVCQNPDETEAGPEATSHDTEASLHTPSTHPREFQPSTEASIMGNTTRNRGRDDEDV
jgi:hypothetical protein